MNWVSDFLCSVDCAAHPLYLNPLSAVYVHRGRALDKKLSLKEQGVRNSSTLYVMMRKRAGSELEPRPELHLPPTDEKLKQITGAFKRFTASRLWVSKKRNITFLTTTFSSSHSFRNCLTRAYSPAS